MRFYRPHPVKMILTMSLAIRHNFLRGEEMEHLKANEQLFNQSEQLLPEKLDILSDVTSKEEFNEAFQEILSFFGFEEFNLSVLQFEGKSSGDKSRISCKTLASNWSQTFEKLFMNRKFYECEMFRQIVLNYPAPMVWASSRNLFPDDLLGRDLYQEAVKQDMHDVVTIPVYRINDYEIGIVTLTGDHEHLSQNELMVLRLVTEYMFQKVSLIVMKGERISGKKGMLTKREIECLELTAIGKTAIEIGMILGISPNTVNEHFINIRHKLNTSNKIHSTAEAIRLGLI